MSEEEKGEASKGDEGGENSKLEKLTSAISNKIEQMENEFKKEIQEEMEEKGVMIDNAKDTAKELAAPETIDKFIDIIREKPDSPDGITAKLWLYIIWKFITSVCLKLLDIGTDIAAASEHFERRDWLYGALTLFFVYLPGFVLSAALSIWGLFYKRIDGKKKEITLERLGRYTLVLFLFPLAYPLIQIGLALLMVILMVRRRDKEAKRFMGHDLNQFKSLEGFLESGPSFCLQTYILMLGHYKGTNIDWNNINMDDLERVGLLAFSSLISFVNLTKTAYKVNVPDPDSRRKQKQHPDNPKYFKLTLLLFNIFCILYRLIGISYFCVYLRNYAILVIFIGYFVNWLAFFLGGAELTIAIVLSAISIFVPNGYLLHNFAGTLEVDLTSTGSKIVFLTNTIGVNFIWAGGIAAVYGLIGSDLEWILRRVLGVLSLGLGILHWFVSIEPLFRPSDEEPNQTQEEGDETLELETMDS